MEAYTGFITAVPWNVAQYLPPNGWALCNGASIAVNQNQALYSLIGNAYGGTAIAFNLPDLRGRVIVGAGQGPGLRNYTIGQKGGSEFVTLTLPNLPPHNHPVVVSNPNLPVTGNVTATMNVNNASAGSGDPSGAFLGNLSSSSGDTIYASSQNATMNAGAISVQSNLQASLNSAGINTGVAGSGVPVKVMQPYLAMTYIICLQGIYPSPN